VITVCKSCAVFDVLELADDVGTVRLEEVFVVLVLFVLVLVCEFIFTLDRLHRHL